MTKTDTTKSMNRQFADFFDDSSKYLTFDQLSKLSRVSTSSLFRGLNNLKHNRFIPKNKKKLLKLAETKYKIGKMLKAIKSTENPNALTKYNDTPLYLIVRNDYNNSDINMTIAVKALIKAGAIINGVCTFAEAIRSANIDVIRAFVNTGYDVNYTEKYHTKLIFDACDTCDTNFADNNSIIIKILIDAGADINVTDHYGHYSPLSFSVDVSYNNAIRALLENGADVNLGGLAAKTPLHLAVKRRNKLAIPILIDYGADLEIVDDNNETALEMARRMGNVEIIELLEEAGGS